MGTRDDRPLVLVVEDEPNIASFARMYLEAAGFRVSIEHRGDEGLAAAERDRPDMVVLDLMLPGLDGYEITRAAAPGGGARPIIMLTARDDAVDKVVGLELGADDYLTKPFNPRELVARVRAVLRRADSRPAGPAARRPRPTSSTACGSRSAPARPTSAGSWCRSPPRSSTC